MLNMYLCLCCLQVVFGSIVLLMLWLPIRIIKLLLPTFLPYNVMLYRYSIKTTWTFNPYVLILRS